MSASAQVQQGVKTLTKKLRDFSVKYVKISEAEMAHSRELVGKYVEGQVMKYCQENSTLPILRLEYAGSVYEGLKTEAADEVDIKVVLKTNKQEVTVEGSGIPGYVKIKASSDSELCKYASPEGYINPERLRNGWFHSLVDQAVNDFNKSSHCDVRLFVRYHGPATQLDITRKTTGELLLSADLVPCIHIGADDYFVAKGAHPNLLWKRSFSLMEKALLHHMDTDYGCRHELLRIVKTIVNRENLTLPALESYHVKTAFMHYLREKPTHWSDETSLGEHFIGFVGKLLAYLEEGSLPNYWLPALNLLQGIDPRVVRNTANRLKNILRKKRKRDKVLDLAQVQQRGTLGDPLTKKLRDFSVKYVKISEADMACSKELVRKYVEGQVMVYFQQNSALPILRLEYAGSVYEGLKTEAADEVDIKVVLKTNKQEVTVEGSGIPGYVKIKASIDSELCTYAGAEGYINPERLRNKWFHSLVDQAKNDFNKNSHCDVRLVVRYHGPATQLDITRKATGELLLSADLVPCIHTGADDYFVAKGAHPNLLWKKSFSLMEKALLHHMDTDYGCRHELLRIVKTIVNREPTSLPALESYHLKTAFMHYLREKPSHWSDENSLEEHFIGFLGKLRTSLREGELPNYWLPAVNLFEGIKPRVVEHMANRVRNIMTKKRKRDKVLT